ncbi:MAG: hypothetical protein QXR87_07215 [Candidatus Hadarchaeales archaeon]
MKERWLTLLLPLAIVGVGFLDWWLSQPRPTPWLNYDWEASVVRLDNGPPLENLVIRFPWTMVEGKRSGDVRGKGTWVLYRMENGNLFFEASENQPENFLPPRTSPPLIKGGIDPRSPYGPRIAFILNELHPGEVLRVWVPFEHVESERATLCERDGRVRVVFTDMENRPLGFEARFSVSLVLWKGGGENRVLMENFWAENWTTESLWLTPVP